MKYLVVIGGGLTDRPIAEKDNKTPLQIAETPHLDKLASTGCTGSVQTVPESMDPGADVSFLSLLGLDPETFYSSPAALEAEALDIKIGEDEIPVCCDFINLQSSHTDMVMKDFTAGNLSSEVSRHLLEALQEQISDVSVRFYPGEGYHNLMVLKGSPISEKLSPPHEIVGEGIRQFMPDGEKSGELVYILNQAQIILHNHPYNQKRRREGKDTVNSVWLWGCGALKPLPSFPERFKKEAAVVTASLLFKGMAKCSGMKTVNVEGATGYVNTNYRGKVEAALRELEQRDVVYLHAGAAEEISLRGLFDDKILAIEDFDREIVGPLYNALKDKNDVKMIILVNHGASAVLMKYCRDRVPFVVHPAKGTPDGVSRFDETLLDSAANRFNSGPDLIEAFLKKEFK